MKAYFLITWLCVLPQNKGIGFFTTRQFPLSDGLCSVRIREPNLCFAFHGWMTHLPGSNLTWTAKETAETLDRLVESGT